MNDDQLSAPSRRQVLRGALAAGLGAALLGNATSRAQPVRPAELSELAPDLRELREAYLKLARQWTQGKQLARGDGYIYTVDVGQLMICFANARDEGCYSALREHAVSHLIRNDRSEPYTQGFVSWRYREGEKLDASGTTEALRLARGLWLGAKAFNRPADADLAALVLDGYSRHAAVDQGIWIIRNYFGFVTHAFASNSFLVDYDPDFVQQFADERKDAELAKLAERSYGAVKMAVAPSGLLYDLIQPELKTLYPELDVVAFSPNDVVQFSNCATVAATVARGLPDVARRVLAFALDRLEDLRIYYYGRTGKPVNERAAGLFELSALVRLATLLGSNTSAATIAGHALPKWKYFATHNDPSQSYLVTEILMAIDGLLGAKG